MKFSPTSFGMLPHVTRYILLGPILGASIGLTQDMVTTCVWLAHGQPDFYFRGWQGVWLTLAMLQLGGLITGVPFGAVVAGWEYMLSRRVNVAVAFPCTIVGVAAAAWAMVQIEFARNEPLPAFSQQGVFIAIAASVLFALSRRVKPNESLRQTAGA